MHVCVLSCGAKKRSQAAPARELYVGPLFTEGLRYAESLRPDRLLILSAAFGLVEPDRVLPPYNVRLPASGLTQDHFGLYVREQLVRLFPAPGELTILAGEDYAALLRPLADDGWTIREPIAGLQLGQIRAWYRSHQ